MYSWYIHVVDPSGDEYDVGPFEAATDPFHTDTTTAVDWIYRQIGLVKAQSLDATLIKHQWHYSETGTFTAPDCQICIEIAGYKLEVKQLRLPKFSDLAKDTLETFGE